MMLRSISHLLARSTAAALAAAVLFAWQLAPMADLGRHLSSSPAHEAGQDQGDHWCQGSDLHGETTCAFVLSDLARDATHHFPAPPISHLSAGEPATGFAAPSAPRALARAGQALPRAPPTLG